MHALLLLSAISLVQTAASRPREPDATRWARHAAAVTIVRDDWGIAHVQGKTDADAVFGMIYAQAEDDFNRVETNYLNAMGRLAEAEGESAIWQDLRMKLFIRPDSLRAQYAASPAWLRRLMDAWADGLNFYLHGHPGCEAAGHHAVRALDGALLHRGQHRRRHRERGARRARAFYGDSAGRPAPASSSKATASPAEPTARTASRSRRPIPSPGGPSC